MIRWRTLRPSSACLNSSLWFSGVRSPSAHAPVALPACRAGRAGAAPAGRTGEVGAADTRSVFSRGVPDRITVHYMNPQIALCRRWVPAAVNRVKAGHVSPVTPGTGRSSATFGTEYPDARTCPYPHPPSPRPCSRWEPRSARWPSPVPPPRTPAASPRSRSTPSRRPPAPTPAPAASSATRIQGSQLCYTLEVRGLSLPAVAAHIHKAPRHVAGPIVIPFPAVPSATTFEASACVTPAAALLADLQANPKAYYVNVHTATFPGGEVRGQLK